MQDAWHDRVIWVNIKLLRYGASQQSNRISVVHTGLRLRNASSKWKVSLIPGIWVTDSMMLRDPGVSQVESSQSSSSATRDGNTVTKFRFHERYHECSLLGRLKFCRDDGADSMRSDHRRKHDKSIIPSELVVAGSYGCHQPILPDRRTGPGP